MRRRKLAGVLASTVVGVMVLAGCSSAEDGASATGQENTVLRVAQDLTAAPGPIFDSVDIAGGFPSTWMSLIYGSMAMESPEGLQPGLATSWEFPDSRTVVLELREGVSFQDGTPFNAEAVKTSWDRIIANDTMSKAAGHAAMESVEVTDEYGVTVNFSSDVTGDWRDQMLISGEALAVVSPTALEELGDDYSSAPVGAGPFRLESYEPGQQVVLKAWDGFYDPSLQSVGTVEFIQTNPGAATVASMIAENIDIARVSFEDAASLQSQNVGVEVAYPTTNISSFLAFCTTEGPLQELDARKAIAHAVDMDDLVERAYNGLSEPATFPLNPTSTHWQEHETPYRLDVDEATSLAESSGLSGQTLKFLAGSHQIKVAEVLQQQLAEAGITVEIEPVANIFQSAQTEMPDMMLVSGSRLHGLGSFLNPDGPANWCGNPSPGVVDAWTATRNTSLDDAGLSDAWAGLQEAIDDELPVYFVNAFADPVAFNPDRVEGVNAAMNLREGAVLSFADLSVTE